MTEHTPGPWEVEDDVYVVEVASRDIVARCENDFPRDVQESNARLITAAPEMLEKLIEIHAYFIDQMGESEGAEELAGLIAKARGE